MREDKVIKILNDVKYQFQASIDEVAVDKDCEEAYEDNKSVVESLDIAIKTIENQKTSIEELKKIKEEIEELEYDDFDCNLVLPAWKVYDIIDNYIEELKGENNGETTE